MRDMYETSLLQPERFREEYARNLANALFMPTCGALVEILPKTKYYGSYSTFMPIGAGKPYNYIGYVDEHGRCYCRNCTAKTDPVSETEPGPVS